MFIQECIKFHEKMLYFGYFGVDFGQNKLLYCVLILPNPWSVKSSFFGEISLVIYYLL